MLARPHRFHGLNSLSFAYRQGSTVRGSQVSLKYIRNQRRQTYRAAVVVSRKVDKSAVVRNRIRRRVYAVIEQQAASIEAPYDLIFTAFNNELANVEPAQLKRSIVDLLTKAGVITTINQGSRAIVKNKE